MGFADGAARWVLRTTLKIDPKILNLDSVGRALVSKLGWFGKTGGVAAATGFTHAFGHDAIRGLEREMPKQQGRFRALFQHMFSGVWMGVGQSLFFGGMRALNPMNGLGFVTGYASQIQGMRTGIGGLLNAGAGIPIGDAMLGSDAVLSRLRKEAARSPGELQDYAQTFQTIMTPVMQAGGQLEDVVKATRMGIGVGAAMEGQTGIQAIGLDIVQGLSTGAQGRATRLLVQSRDPSTLVRGVVPGCMNESQIGEPVPAPRRNPGS